MKAFRLHPIVPFNALHVSMSDTTITNYFIPKGSHVLLSRPSLGHNPRIWDNPLTFNPERHLKDDGSEVALTKSELRLLSFSVGQRGCSRLPHPPPLAQSSSDLGRSSEKRYQSFGDHCHTSNLVIGAPARNSI
ncbi:hypothetical protein LguiA_029634 [Lonicera macranthoides]